MITAETLAARLDTLLGGDRDRQVIAEAVLQIIALDSDQLIVLPVAPEGSPADHHTIARVVAVGGATARYVADPASIDGIRNRFLRGHL